MTPIHQIGEAVRAAMLSIPLPLVRALFVATCVAVLVWVLRLPRSATTPPQGANRWDENLRITAAVAVVIQIVVYCWL